MIFDIELDLDKTGAPKPTQSTYKPTDDEQEIISLIIKHFEKGYLTMNTPRREFNELSLITRMQRDQLTFNTYNSNDGVNEPGLDSWKSNAMRPIARNKAISIAAHVTSRLLFPQIFAQTQEADDDRDSAQVMRYLMEWAADQSEYERTQVYAAIAALVNPAAIIHTEYAEVYDADGALNEELSGFKDTLVPCDELFIENIYEHDIQKQGFLIWRRVISYDLAKRKYGKKYADKFKYVKPGLQVLFDPGTNSFYELYDQNLSENLVEEIIYWNKSMNVKLTMVNGVLLTDYDTPNPRVDKKYPFVKFGYELIDEGKFFYYKSLIFKMTPDTRIINTLYSMVIDGTYLNIFPPMVVQGDEEISSDVIVPGAVTTFENPGSSVTPIMSGSNIMAGFNAMREVENSIIQTSASQELQGIATTKRQTATESEILQANAAQQLGIFARMIAFAVKDYGWLRINDILQYMTVGEVLNLVGEGTVLKFRNVLLQDKEIDGKTGSIKVEFTLNTPTTPEGVLERSKELLKREGLDNNKRILQVNPYLFRNLKYMVRVSPDLFTQPSEAVKKALALEAYDRAIQNPLVAQNAVNLMNVTKDLLFRVFPQTADNPDKYLEGAAGPQAAIAAPAAQAGAGGMTIPDLQGVTQ